MAPKPPGVMAAPNKVRVRARVLELQQDSQFRDKWRLEMEILGSESIKGPNFARVGERVKGFAFEDTPNFSPQDMIIGSIVIAEAEYVGDAKHGAFRLSRIEGAT